MKTNADARQRLLNAAAEMLGTRGLSATSVRELAKYAKAPLGSTYHYFPGGKQQLVSEALSAADGYVSQLLQSQLAKGPVEGVKAFVALWKKRLLSDQFNAGCPVLAVSIAGATASDEPEPAAQVAGIFAGWEGLLSQALTQRGCAEAEAKRLATLIVAAIEGAIALCRAKRSLEPLEVVADELIARVESVTEPAGGAASL